MTAAITSVTANPANGSEDIGSLIAITVALSQPVTVSGGTPALALNDGVLAYYDAAKSTPTSLVFDYTVAVGEDTPNLAVTGVVYNDATIADNSGIAADFSTVATTFTGLQVHTSTALFVATSGPGGLWVTDGTAAGTHQIFAGNAVNPMLVGNQVIFLSDYGDPQYGLGYGVYHVWSTDGTTAVMNDGWLGGESFINDQVATLFTTFGSDALFVTTPPSTDPNAAPLSELWSSDGTAVTLLYQDIGEPWGGSFVLGNKLFFTSIFVDQSGNQTSNLYVTDGTPEGTLEIAADLSMSFLADLGNKALFSGFSGTQAEPGLWVTDGTAQGTVDLVPGLDVIGGGAVLDNKVFFEAIDAQGESGAWVTDGTATGTDEVAPGWFGNGFVALNGNLLYFTTDANDQQTLWTTDSSFDDETELASGFYGNGNLALTGLTATLNDRLLFNAGDADGRFGLWITDGTGTGTKEIQVAGAYESGQGLNPHDMTAFGDNEILFVGTDAAGDTGVWVTDGTSAGTVEIASGAPLGLNPFYLTTLPTPSLFTLGADMVDFNNLLPDQIAKINEDPSSLYATLGGNDNVVLPNIDSSGQYVISPEVDATWDPTQVFVVGTSTDTSNNVDNITGGNANYKVEIVGPATVNVAITGKGDSGTPTGGTLTITSAFEGSATIGNWSTLELGGPATGETITFDPTGTKETLRIDGTIMPTNVISGLAQGDTIDLAGVSFAAGGSAILQSFGGGAQKNILTISENGNSYNLNLDPSQSFAGEQFELASDGNGGTYVTVKPGLDLNLTFDQSQSDLPISFVQGVDAAAYYYEQNFINPLTININVGYGEVAGNSSALVGNNGASSTYYSAVSYSTASTALAGR